MQIKTTYENLLVGETVRVFLKINDLLDSNGKKIHLDNIKKIVIEKQNSGVFSLENKTVKSFYGNRNPKIIVSESVDFDNFLNPQGSKVVLDDGSFRIKIINPDSIAEYFEIKNVVSSKELIISGVFSEIPNGIDFQIVDSNFQIISNLFESSVFCFDENFNSYDSLWKMNQCFFEDKGGFDFSTLFSGYSGFLSDLNGYKIAVSKNKQDFYSFDCLTFNKTNSFSSFLIKGFSCIDNNKNEIYQWKMFNSLDEEVDLTLLTDKSNGRISWDSYSPIGIDICENSNNEEIYTYFIDWKIDEIVDPGTYTISWYFKRPDKQFEEIITNNYIINADSKIPVKIGGKFNRENYHEFVKSYLPFFYTDYQEDSVLNQTIKAFSESIFDLKEKSDDFLNILDPNKAQPSLLQYLSNLFSFKLRGNDPSSWRQQLTNIPHILKKKGTMDGLIDILNLMNVDVDSINFYWQVKSKYLTTDYFYLTNDGLAETLSLRFNPVSQTTENYGLLYGIETQNKGHDFSRYKIEYYSQSLNSSYDVFPIYNNLNELINDFQKVINLTPLFIEKDKTMYSNKIHWNFNEKQKNIIYIKHDLNIDSPFSEENVAKIIANNNIKYKVWIKSGDVKTGAYYFDINSISLNETEFLLEIKYFDNYQTIFNSDSVDERIVFDILANDDLLEIDGTIFDNISGYLRVEEQTVGNIKTSDGTIIVKNKISGEIETITPAFNDVLIVRYQSEYYPYETNSSSSGYLVNFDSETIDLDDSVLMLDLMDDRSFYDDSFENQRIIPKVNLDIKLLTDYDSSFVNDNNEFASNDSVDITSLCSKRNGFHDPIVFGRIRTKFPYSENVYNMDEYDGSTRPSINPCDIDEFFTDSCGCCWSSNFSMSVKIPNLSDKTIQIVRDTISEFKPFHARLRNLSCSGKFQDKIFVNDKNMETDISFKIIENVNLGYYPVDQKSNSVVRKKRSKLVKVFQDKFSTSSVDIQNNIILTDNNIDFSNEAIYAKNTQPINDILPLLNNNVSFIHIESGTSIHSNNIYNIDKIDNNKLIVSNSTDGFADQPPLIPYVEESVNYKIYNQKYPFPSNEFGWNTEKNVNITKFGVFSVSSSSLSSFDLQNIETGLNQYKIRINSGGIYGDYVVENIIDNKFYINDYNLNGQIGNIIFSILKNNELLEDLSNISGIIEREYVKGKCQIIDDSEKSTRSIVECSSSFFVINGLSIDDALRLFTRSTAFEVIDSLGNDGVYSVANVEKYNNAIKIYVLETIPIVSNVGKIKFTPIDLFYDWNIELKKIFIKINKNFYKISSFIGSEIIFDDFANETAGDRDVVICEEIIAGSGEISAFTNKINLAYTDFETFSNSRKEDFIVSILQNGNKKYYTIEDIVSANCIKLLGAKLDDIISADDISIYCHELTSNKISKLIPFNSTLKHVISGTISSISSNSFDDTSKDFVDLSVKQGDLISFEEEKAWAIVTNVSGSNCQFDNFTSIYNVYVSTDFLNKPYSIIRRSFYDTNLDIPKFDILKINIDDGYSQDTFNNLLIPIKNMFEYDTYKYAINLDYQDKKEYVISQNAGTNKTMKILVGPLDYIDIKYLPANLDQFRIINKQIEEDGNLVKQFYFSVFDSLSIEKNSFSITVNGLLFSVVEKWTNPASGPAKVGLKECVLKKISNYEYEIWFGDGYTGKEVFPGDVVIATYETFGDEVLKPNKNEQINTNETLIFEMEDVNTQKKLEITISI